MIRTEKIDSALYAFSGLLFRSRAMAYNHDDHEAIAEVLDFAEYLPLLLASPEDNTEEFRYFLEGLSAKHPAFGFVLERFDDRPPAGWWE